MYSKSAILNGQDQFVFRFCKTARFEISRSNGFAATVRTLSRSFSRSRLLFVVVVVVVTNFLLLRFSLILTNFVMAN